MTDRDAILSAIRRALVTPGPPPDGTHAAGSPREAAAEASRWLPECGATEAEWRRLFAAKSAALQTQFIEAESGTTCHQHLAQLASIGNWQRIAVAGDAWISSIAAALPVRLLRAGEGYDRQELENCDAAITGCDALIAQTGSVLLTSRSTGGRAVSVLPPHHVVLAKRDQLLPDLPAAFAHLHRTCGPDNWPSMISIVTGPSRTADIERILVLGAHGPRKLTILLSG